MTRKHQVTLTKSPGRGGTEPIHAPCCPPGLFFLFRNGGAD